MNLDELLENAHCSDKKDLCYNVPLDDVTKELLSKSGLDVVKAYCLVEATTCPFYVVDSLNKDNHYCRVSSVWLSEKKYEGRY
jgi:hypothetical protein